MATPPPPPPPPPAGPGAACSPGKGCCSGCCKIAKILLVIGGINWGLIGLGGFLGMNLNVVEILLGSGVLSNIVYILVGLAAVKELVNKGKC